MKTITIMAKGNGTLACLTFKTDAKWMALSRKDIKKMKKFHPDEVVEINIGSDDSLNFLRQGCKVDFAYVIK